MLIDSQGFESALKALVEAPVIALDTETTGLYPWQNDRLFSIICSTKEQDFYFDFNDLGDRPPTLPREWIARFTEVFSDARKVIYFMNAKFDMAFLWRAGVTNVTQPIVVDAQVMARLLRNDLMTTSMDALAPWVGKKKSDSVKQWCMANGAWEWEYEVDASGNRTRHKKPLFWKAPLEIVQSYAETDSRITYDLGVFIMEKLKATDDERLPHQPSVLDCVNTEIEVTKTLFEMEREGVLVDLEYIRDAEAFERERYEGAAAEFELATGVKFSNGAKVLGRAFESYAHSDRHRFKYTATGLFCTKDEVLSTFTSPLAQVVKEHRDAYKRAGTYFGNYQSLVDGSGVIHPNFRQGGPRTGRLSCSDPNLQNVQKSADRASKWPVRRCFIPPAGFLWASIDWDQMEYRLMLDYAGELGLIKQVLEGLDVHEATARMMGKSRQEAKTLNFMLLYGGGVAKLCAALFDVQCDIDQLQALWRLHNQQRLETEEKKLLLSVTPEMRNHDIPKLLEAQELRELYFSRLPKVKELIDAIITQARNRGMIFSWCGRMFQFPDRRFAYKAPNYLIQGGCADIMKKALNQMQAYLKERKARSTLRLVVHDEPDLYVHPSELDILPACKGIMETVYPHKHLPLTAGIAVSEVSWADVEDFDEWLSKKRLSSPSELPAS